MKHVLPRLPRTGKAVFATLSARLGSIGDNRLGGWYAYRASKAALNQLVRTAAIELARQSRDALCIALHPGTVATTLSAPFAASATGIVHAPAAAARHLLGVVDRLAADASRGFFDWRKKWARAWEQVKYCSRRCRGTHSPAAAARERQD